MNSTPADRARRLAAAIIWGAVLLAATPAIREAFAGGGAIAALSPAQARDLMGQNRGKPDFVILDVRTPGEFADGHIAGAVLIDYTAPQFRNEISKLDRSKVYLVYCQVGARSSSAVRLMSSLGFGRIYHLEGGFAQWRGEGLPAAK